MPQTLAHFLAEYSETELSNRYLEQLTHYIQRRQVLLQHVPQSCDSLFT